VGPLFASDLGTLSRAREIRRRIVRLVLEDANDALAQFSGNAEAGRGYLVALALLRVQYEARWWLELADAVDPVQIITRVAMENGPVLRVIPATDAECYRQEGEIQAHLRKDAPVLWGPEDALY
jgi:hypothetical protein